MRFIVPNDASLITQSELPIFVLDETSKVPANIVFLFTFKLPPIIVLPEPSTLKLPLLRFIVPNDASLITQSELPIFVLHETSKFPPIIILLDTFNEPSICVVYPSLCNNIFLDPEFVVHFDPGNVTSKSFLSAFIKIEPTLL